MRNNLYWSLKVSILGPLLFNNFLNDLFLAVTHSHLSNYADDNTLDSFGSSINNVNSKLRIDLAQVIEWFNGNCMVLNAGKFHNLFLRKDSIYVKFYFNGNTYVNSKEEKNISYYHR